MNGGSSPKGPVSEGKGTDPTGCGLTDDICGVVLNHVSERRIAVAIDDPTGPCSLVKLCLNSRTEFVSGAGLPIRFPT